MADVVRTITIRSRSEGVDQTTASLHRMAEAQTDVAKSSGDVSRSSVDMTQAIDRNTRALESAYRSAQQFDRATKAANDNVRSFGSAMNDHVRSVSEAAVATSEWVSRLKLLAGAAYVAIPAFRSWVNQGIKPTLSALASMAPTAASVGGKIISSLTPAIGFIARLAVPIGLVIAAFEAMNKITELGAERLKTVAKLQEDAFKAAGRLAPTRTEVFTTEDLANANAMNDRINAANAAIREGLHPIMRDLTALGVRFNETWVQLIELIGRATGALGRFYERQFQSNNVLSQTLSRVFPSFGGGARTAEGPGVADLSAIDAARVALRGYMQDQRLVQQSTEELKDAGRLLRYEEKKNEDQTKNTTKAIKEKAAAYDEAGEFERRAIERIRSQVEASEREVANLFQSAEAALSAKLAQEALSRARERNIELTADQIKNIEKEAAVAAKIITANKQLVEAFGVAKKAAEQFTSSLVQGLLQGQGLVEALENSFRSLASQMANVAITQAFNQNFLAAGIAGAIAVGSAIFGNMLREDREERERQQKIAENRAENLGLHQTLLGVIPGSVSESIQNVFDQVVQAGREAAELGDAEEVIRLGNEFQAFLQRTLEEFRRGLPNLIRYLEETANLNNSFSQAAQQMRQLGDALLGIAADISLAGLGGGTETEAQFLAAAQGAVLAMVRGAEEMSDLQTALQSAQGAAHEAVRVLQQLGMSAEDAAAAVEESLIVALDRLRTEAIDQLTRKINELLGRGYINDFLDLFEEVTTLMQDFASLNLDPALINQFFTLAAQDIVNQAQLTGQAFQDLLAVFPQLVGVVTEFVDVADTLDETTARVTEAQENLRRAYEEESRALQQSIDRMRNFAEQLRNLRRSLLLDPSVSVLSPQQRFEEAQRQFRETAEKALTGDEEALGNLQDISKKYLDEAAAYYASSEQYFQAFNEVQSVLEQAEQYASAQVDIAQQQLDALTQQVSLLIDINDSVMSVAEAIEALMGARDWGRRPEANQQLVAALRAVGVDYTGGFGAGQFNVWAAAQSQATQAVINQIVQQMGLQQGGLIRAFNGGLITNGLWNVDSVMARFQGGGTAMLAGGEFVTRAPSVTPATLPTLAHINATGRAPANDNRENFKELARVIMRENRELRNEVAELRAAFHSSMKMVADATRQTSNEQQRRRAN